MKREEAYDLVQKRAMQAWEEQKQFKDLLEQDETIKDVLTVNELNECFNYQYHLKQIEEIFTRVGLK